MPSDDPILQVFGRAAADREHGAAEIETELIRGLLERRASWRRGSLVEGARLLVSGQPAMANLRSLARRLREQEMPGVTAALEQRLHDLHTLPGRLAEAAWPWIAGAARIVTLSRSSAVAAAVEGARRRGWAGTVVVLDGSEAGGGPDQAQRLAAGGPTLSQPDATALRWLSDESVVVVVGADAVGAERFVNCVGTGALLSLAASRRHPRLLAADRGKDLPEPELDELLEHAPRHRDHSGREWPVFEAVPIALLTERLCESS